jgi:hypothetical protein
MAKVKQDRSHVRAMTFEMDPAVYAAFEAFCAKRGEKKGQVIVQALRRHMASPPPLPELPPLPPVRPRGRPRKVG